MYKNGDRFEGYFRNGLKSGPGVMKKFESGETLAGIWDKDEQVSEVNTSRNEFFKTMSHPYYLIYFVLKKDAMIW